MRKSHWTLRFAVYTAFFLATAWGSPVVLSKLELYRAEVSDQTWVPDTQVQQLMEYHRTGVLEITRDEVYVLRNAKWIPVLKRVHG